MEANGKAVSSVDLVYEAILRAERRLEESFESDAGVELELADRSASLLTTAMGSVEQRSTANPDEVVAPASSDTRSMMLFALQAIGARALRVMRAARASLAIGYEAESLGHDRILIEFVTHRRTLFEDGTGKEAWAWLEAERGRGIGKRVAKSAPDGLYALLSQNSHADPRPLANLSNYDKKTLSLAPKRTGATSTSLLLHASFATDQAEMIAALADIQLREHSDLRDAIQARWSELKG